MVAGGSALGSRTPASRGRWGTERKRRYGPDSGCLVIRGVGGNGMRGPVCKQSAHLEPVWGTGGGGRDSR